MVDHRPVVLARREWGRQDQPVGGDFIPRARPGPEACARLSEIDRRAQGHIPSGSPIRPPIEPTVPGPGWSVAAQVMTPEGPRDLGTGRETKTDQAAQRPRAARTAKPANGG